MTGKKQKQNNNTCYQPPKYSHNFKILKRESDFSIRKFDIKYKKNPKLAFSLRNYIDVKAH